MEPGFVEDFGRRWQDAVNRQAIEELLEFCVEDIELVDPGLQGPVRGRAAVRDYYVNMVWTAFPDVRFTRPDPPYLVAPDGPVAIARWAASGTMGGKLVPPGFWATNCPVQFHGVDIWYFEEGKVRRWESLYDSAQIGRQVGALPAVGSRGERLAVLLQRLTARWMRRVAN